MGARITRELLGPVAFGLRKHDCLRCGERIVPHDGCYRCHDCDMQYCMSCGMKMAIGPQTVFNDQSRLVLGAGDLILTGPCVTVSHVILVTTDLQEADAEARRALAVGP